MTFLTAHWRKLIMAQYEVAPSVLAPHLPAGLELDLFHGRCFVSLVGFLFDRVRILGVPIPLHTRFEEANLRFYVLRRLPDGSTRRGVVFLSEIVPRPAITLVARTLYGEAYTTAPMTHRWSTESRSPENRSPESRSQARHDPTQPLEVTYAWRHRRVWQSLGVRAGHQLRPIAPGSMEAFTTEHYWGYTPRRGGGTSEYAVEHRPWKTYPVEQHRVACDFGALYGPAFADLSHRAPDHVLLAEGAPVRIRWGGRLPRT